MDIEHPQPNKKAIQHEGLSPISREELDQQVAKASAASKTLADQIIDLAVQEGLKLFQDEFHNPYARFFQTYHWEIWPVESKTFRRWLISLYWRSKNKVVPSESVAAAVETLCAEAVCAGPMHKLHVRVAWHKESIYYDLTDAGWRVVRIFPGGWEIDMDPPIIFSRSNHEAPQVEPIRNGDVKAVLQFINVTSDVDKLLALIAFITACIPEIPHPIDVCYGQHGAAKTTLAEAKKSLVDPSRVEHFGFPSSTAELAQLLQHTWYTTFDNIGELSDAWSDMLCRAVTGSGFMKRKLYSDADDVIFQYRRCIGLNSINLPVRQPDLLDRSLLFRMERIPKDKTIDRNTFWQRFEQLKPGILGGMFDVLAKALEIYPNVKKLDWGRMADFGRWGCAIAEALGYSQGQFIGAYEANTSRKNEEAIVASPVAVVLRSLMKNHAAGWSGTPTDLFHEMNTEAINLEIDIKHRPWPQAPNALSRELNKVKSNLAYDGIVITQEEGGDNRYCITDSSKNRSKNITNTKISPQATPGSGKIDTDGNNDKKLDGSGPRKGDKSDICDISQTFQDNPPKKNPWAPGDLP